MATLTVRGTPATTAGELPAVGERAPAFTLVDAKFAEVTSGELAGRRVVLNIFLSIDTAVCAASVRRFNQEAAGRDDVTVLSVSEDLPFALDRFCGAEGIEDVVTTSSFRSTFGDDYGVRMTDGPRAGLLARAVVVLDTDGTVLHAELVDDTGHEPDYEAALAVL